MISSKNLIDSFPNPIRFSGNGLLKPLQPQDIPLLWILLDKNRDYLEQWITWPKTIQSIDHVQQFIQGVLLFAYQGKEMNWGLWQEDLLVGLVGLHQIQWKTKYATLGYWIDEEYQHQGLMSLALQKLLEEIYENLPLKTLEIHTRQDNASSIGLAKKLGFSFIEVKNCTELLYRLQLK